MVIARSPLRITLGGGGTDLPSYYREHEGFVIAAAIDKYVYVSVNRPFIKGIHLKYSEVEFVASVEEVKHRIMREALRMQNLRTPQIEITTSADIPAGTGLGSSGSFTTALLKALHAYRHMLLHPQQLAEMACHVEIDGLGEPIGKQDQYIAAFGGVTCFRYKRDDSVEAWPLDIKLETLHSLEDNLLLFLTGYSRSASDLLKEQKTRTLSNDREMIENLHLIKELGLESQKALEAGNLHRFAELMNVHWEHKKKRSSKMTNDKIERWYRVALDHGALGGKLIGAGGGGFLMFYAEDKTALRNAMNEEGLAEVRFGFDFEGTQVIVHS
jgi:D-glycero-alpha-D-manno-heptose-7-phosphate kinase